MHPRPHPEGGECAFLSIEISILKSAQAVTYVHCIGAVPDSYQIVCVVTYARRDEVLQGLVARPLEGKMEGAELASLQGH